MSAKIVRGGRPVGVSVDRDVRVGRVEILRRRIERAGWGLGESGARRSGARGLRWWGWMGEQTFFQLMSTLFRTTACMRVVRFVEDDEE